MSHAQQETLCEGQAKGPWGPGAQGLRGPGLKPAQRVGLGITGGSALQGGLLSPDSQGG